tara:strand:- start:3709 stop:3933 length:225 start_codon:yes stop_codon:yes gene_type:complete
VTVASRPNNRSKPAREGGWIPEVAQLLMGGEESLLGRIVGTMEVSQQCVNIGHCHILKIVDKPVEGPDIARLRA